MGVTRGVTLEIVPTRGIYMDTALNTENENEKDGKLGQTGQDIEMDSDMGKKKVSELERTKNFMQMVMERRRIRVNLEGPYTKSAPTSPVFLTSESEAAWSEGEFKSAKRRRNEFDDRSREIVGGGSRALAARVRRVIQDIGKEIKMVADLAKERNTKREIKDTASKLKNLMAQLQTSEAQALLQRMGNHSTGEPEETNPKDMQDQDKHKLLEEEVKDLRQEMERLQEENRKMRERLKTVTQRKGRGTENSVTEEQIEQVKSFQELSKLQAYHWPNQVFKMAHLARGNLLNVSKDADLALLTEDGKEEESNKEINKEITQRYPELNNMVGKISLMTVATKVEDISGHRESRDRIIFKAELEEEQEDWFNAIAKIRDKMVVKKRNKLVLQPLPKDRKGTQLRRIVESVFRNTGIKCIIVTNEDEDSGRPKKGRAENKNTEALVIKQEGKTYSDLLKTVKERVKPGTEVANAIKVVRKSRDGNLLILMNKGNSEAIKELKADIEGAAGDIDVRSPRTNGTIFIKDIDGETSREDVENALVREAGIDKDQIEVGALRPYFGGNQAVTIRISKSRMPALLAKGKIRIGLNYCNITEKIILNQCYRCWAFGHRREDCKGEDRSAACRRCGETSHLARDCTKSMFCLNCNTEGHSAGTGRCPEFRKAIGRAKRLLKAKKSY